MSVTNLVIQLPRDESGRQLGGEGRPDARANQTNDERRY